MTISQWPDQERPRERLLNYGSEHLSNSELLAILLTKGTKGKNAIDLARELLNQFNGLRGIFSAQFKMIHQQPGLGVAKYCQIKAALELSKRHLREIIDRQNVITHKDIAVQFLIAQLRDHQSEVFACLFLDSQHRVIEFERLFHGTIHSATIHPREIIKRALHYNAAAIIFAHNHPSGVAEPSIEDCEITRELAKILESIDVRLLDHIIIGEGQTISLAERGIL